jgi:hypothetical protein
MIHANLKATRSALLAEAIAFLDTTCERFLYEDVTTQPQSTQSYGRVTRRRSHNVNNVDAMGCHGLKRRIRGEAKPGRYSSRPSFIDVSYACDAYVRQSLQRANMELTHVACADESYSKCSKCRCHMHGLQNHAPVTPPPT